MPTIEVVRPTISLKKVAPVLFALGVVPSACVGQVPVQIPENPTSPKNPTEIPVQPTVKPTEVAITPTVGADRNYPTHFEGFYLGSYIENGQTKIIGGVDGDLFESKNPGCNIPNIDGHRSQHNTLYNPSASNLPAAFMVPESYLTSLFNASTDKSGGAKGSYKGSFVEFVDNVWKMENGQILNPVVPSLAGHFFGYPVVCEKNGQLMMALADDNGAIIDNTLRPAFQSVTDIAKEYGYTGTGKPASISLKSDGQIEVKDANANILANLRFLGTAETKIFPVVPENVKPMEVYNYTTEKTETISPTFDKDMNTWVWKNTSGEVRRFLDPETGHVFAQTESTPNKVIYQTDTEFGWEADLTVLFIPNDARASMGYQYMSMIWSAYPAAINGLNEHTKLIFKIVHGGYDDIIDKSKVSSIKDLGNLGTEMGFFWPIYNEKNNTQTLKTYLRFDFLQKSPTIIQSYTYYMLNYCSTASPPKDLLIGVLNPSIPKKSIQ